MKKMLLATLLATLAGLSQAMTVSWNSSSGTFNGFSLSDGTAVVADGSKGNFVLTMSIACSTYLANTDYVKLATPDGQGGGLTLAFSTSTAKLTVGASDGTSQTLTSGGDFSSSRVQNMTLAFIFSNYNADAGTYTVQLGAPTAWDSNKAQVIDGYYATATANNVKVGTDPISWTTLTLDTNAAVSSMTLSGEGVVPEPTVLALLALGVAGVALRRRA
ncbi:MAG: PEP-CTERM sorting domain-containing protein [Candidatus Spyradenecus sp.]